MPYIIRPMFASLKKTFQFPLEFILLLGLVITLPSLEAPKNIFWVFFIVSWVINRVRSWNFGGPWDLWDTLITLWILSGYIVAAFAGLHNDEWGGANDILRYGSILWAIKRSGYNRPELKWLLTAILVSTMLALSEGVWQLLVTHKHTALQLNSVGHVNHSAVYLTICYGAALSFLLAYWAEISIRWRLLALGTTLILAISIFISDSRAAVGVSILLTLAIGILYARKSRTSFFVLFLATFLAISAAYFGQVSVVKKHEVNVENNTVLAYRGGIWNVALASWEKFPIFGVGMNNFSMASVEKVKVWREEAGKPFVASQFLGTAHAHSLYMNTLAERGLFGISILLAVLLYWPYQLLRKLPGQSSESLAWALWGASFSAWFTTVGIGYANTTLHHEHAILSVMLLGMWLTYVKKFDSSH